LDKNYRLIFGKDKMKGERVRGWKRPIRGLVNKSSPMKGNGTDKAPDPRRRKRTDLGGGRSRSIRKKNHGLYDILPKETVQSGETAQPT